MAACCCGAQRGRRAARPFACSLGRFSLAALALILVLALTCQWLSGHLPKSLVALDSSRPPPSTAAPRLADASGSPPTPDPSLRFQPVVLDSLTRQPPRPPEPAASRPSVPSAQRLHGGSTPAPSRPVQPAAPRQSAPSAPAAGHVGCATVDDLARSPATPWAKSGELPRVVPVAWNVSLRLPFQRAEPPERCAILVDRHMHKNGGSTMRDLFLENERLGFGLYQGYMQNRWKDEFKVLKRLAQEAASRGTTPQHFLMIEAHYGGIELEATILPDLRELQQIYARSTVGCKLVLTTRVREPLLYYLSFWRWGVEKMQTPPKWRTHGRNFTEWVGMVPNLQSSLLIEGMAATIAEGGPSYYRTHQRGRRIDWPRVTAFLDQFTVVGTVERFDEHLLMVNDVSGLPLLLYKRNVPAKHGRDRRSNPCPDMDACRAAVKAVAPLDYKMYETYGPRFEAQISALGASFEARAAQYKQAVQDVQAPWARMPRKQYLCRFRPIISLTGVDKDLAMPEYNLENLRCPVSDSLELCSNVYAHRAFECPWQFRLENSSISDTLGCWKPSLFK